VYFAILRDGGMKRPGLILHDNETCSTLDVQLVLHKWLCGCSLSHHSKDSIYNSNLIIFVSTLWFLFVGKNGSFSIAPSHVKHAKKIRGV
jgi:hypothetical protein